ncbi:hypothetical protein AMATHDRAFT_9311 [Amanita thiersii Skay4041]|uniref:Uncharacterized protein n=1 Tax=Amanita thiersii Skay4041 TaxID=703135 RepID=A0A2A9NAY0_9AGAR|nr:hypothetical protein AMATHDRAFT_9311 [Amanita thiersii Skay4041]
MGAIAITAESNMDGSVGKGSIYGTEGAYSGGYIPFPSTTFDDDSSLSAESAPSLTEVEVRPFPMTPPSENTVQIPPQLPPPPPAANVPPEPILEPCMSNPIASFRPPTKDIIRYIAPHVFDESLDSVLRRRRKRRLSAYMARDTAVVKNTTIGPGIGASLGTGGVVGYGAPHIGEVGAGMRGGTGFVGEGLKLGRRLSMSAGSPSSLSSCFSSSVNGGSASGSGNGSGSSRSRSRSRSRNGNGQGGTKAYKSSPLRMSTVMYWDGCSFYFEDVTGELKQESNLNNARPETSVRTNRPLSYPHRERGGRDRGPEHDTLLRDAMQVLTHLTKVKSRLSLRSAFRSSVMVEETTTPVASGVTGCTSDTSSTRTIRKSKSRRKLQVLEWRGIQLFR